MPRRKLKQKFTASSSSRSKRESDGTMECRRNPKRTWNRSTATIFSGSIGGVGDDILREILLRLPRESLLSSRLVSTRWLNVTTDPSFVRSHRSLHPPMLGFFFHRSDEDPPTFVPTTQSPDLKESADRVSSALGFLPHQSNLCLVHSCNGMLLLDDHTKGCYFVCNPLKKEWVEIPHPSSANSEAPFHIGLACSEEDPPSFEVVRIVKAEHYNADVERFSPDTRTWTVGRPMIHYSLMWAFYGNVSIEKLRTKTLPVFIGGVLYWLNGEYKLLAYNKKRPDCDLIALNLPKSMSSHLYNSGCLGKAEGRLFYTLVDPTHLRIWVVAGDYPRLKWQLEHQIEWGPRLLSEIRNYERNPPVVFVYADGQELRGGTILANMNVFISEVVRPIGFHCTDSNVVFLSMQNKAFSYHLRTRETKDLSCYGRRAITFIFPYEMTESPTPMLGTIAEECSSVH